MCRSEREKGFVNATIEGKEAAAPPAKLFPQDLFYIPSLKEDAQKCALSLQLLATGEEE